MSRRSILKASAWSVPVIAVAAAVPSAAASVTGQWAIANLQPEFQRDPSGGFGVVDGFSLYVGGDVTSLNGPLSEISAFSLTTDAGDPWIWYYPMNDADFPISTFNPNLSTLNANTVTITAPDGTVFGPYTIDRSQLTNP